MSTVLDVRVLQNGTITGSYEDVDPDLRDLALGFLVEDLPRVEFVWTRPRVPLRIRIERARHRGDRCAHLVGEACPDLPLEVTLRELDVVTLLIAGLTNPAIAAALHLSPRTVTTHLDHVMRKFGVTNRSAVATMALDRGLIGLPLTVETDGLEQLAVGRMVRSAGTEPSRTLQTTRGVPSADPIRIGALIPSQGRARADAVAMVNGAQLAIEQINARGGIQDRLLQMDIADVDVDDEVSARNALDTLLRNGPAAITSGYLAGQLPVMSASATDGVPFLHSSASSLLGGLVAGDTRRHHGVFQFSPDDNDYAPCYVSFVTQLRESGAWAPLSRRLCFAVQSRWEFIDLGIEAAVREAEAAGWEPVVVRTSGRDGDRTWAAAGRAAAQSAPAAVMVGSYFPQDLAAFIHEFRRAPSNTLLYSTYAPSVPGFRKWVGVECEGLVWSTTTGIYADDLGSEFSRAYRARFGRSSGRSHAGIAYDRIHILAHAWRQVSDVRDFDDVADRLSETRYRGVNGAYAFDASTHRTLSLGRASSDPSLAQAHTIFQIQGGRDILISPSLYATGRFVPPPWAPGFTHGENV
ncbi:ABC transporter substrate-binding protein [Rhodococcus opacus]|uniref:ABC transporter substrate-binding protein n=1 Tax=Rhodococcus opacus TaxID=37919 RepID=UPI001C454487|nr:ABC transporter substrate-binding protein [Rhodococcus opacus]MBV6754849.1 ABC transporter substrate-binding protein [Rhodococcus opacus]